MKRLARKSVLSVFCLAFLLLPSLNALSKETRIYSKGRIFSFLIPKGWLKEKKPPKNEIIIFQSERKMPVLNPYIVFSHSKLKNVPSTPPPDDLWGQRVVKQIKEVDEEAKMISAKPSLVAGKPAYISSAYLSYKKLKKSRTFQKSCQIWDGRRKTMFQFVLVCLERDRKTYEPVLDKLLNTVKIKS